MDRSEQLKGKKVGRYALLQPLRRPIELILIARVRPRVCILPEGRVPTIVAPISVHCLTIPHDKSGDEVEGMGHLRPSSGERTDAGCVARDPERVRSRERSAVARAGRPPVSRRVDNCIQSISCQRVSDGSGATDLDICRTRRTSAFTTRFKEGSGSTYTPVDEWYVFEKSLTHETIADSLRP